jgi:LPXTG-site transpeptidase (sortase) family protein
MLLTQAVVLPAVPARAQIISFPAQMNKSFDPINIAPGGISRLSVSIFNPNSFPLTNASWTDNLALIQPGIRVASPPNISNSCGGTVTAAAGGTTLALSGGTVPQKVGATPGSCTVQIDVTSTTAGNLINRIPANTLVSSGAGGTVTNTTPASATLHVSGVQSPSLAKSFTPSSMWAGQVSQLEITIRNNDLNTALTQARLVDSLPNNVVIASPASPTLSGCGSVAALTAASGSSSVTLNNATIAPNTTCVIHVQVTSSTPGVYANTIAPGTLQDQQGVTNSSPAVADLNVQAVGLSKAFSPPSFLAGGTTTLTITLQNPTSAPYTGVSISDTLPGTVLSFVGGTQATTCGGTLSLSLPRTVSLSGGTIPPGTPASPGSCTITVQVTAPAGTSAAAFTNLIPAGTLHTFGGVTNIADVTARVRIIAPGGGMTGNKDFNPAIIQAGENSRLRINLRAPADTALTGFSFTDNLPPNVKIGNSTPATKSADCGASSVLTAATNATSISLSNGTIPAGATCQINVWVTSSVPGVHTNVIHPTDITNNENRRPAGDLTADLTVLGTSDLSVSKVFQPDAVAPDGISTLTITLTNNSASPLVNVSASDTLPGTLSAGLVVAPVPNASTSCGAGTVTAAPGTKTISLSGGTIPAQVAGVPGTCTIRVDVQGKGSKAAYTNTIPGLDVSATPQGTTTVIHPALPASAPLDIAPLSIGIVKGFEPLTVFGGSASTLSIQLVNPNNAGLSGISFTDDMPSGMVIANPPALNVGTCGGVLAGSPGTGGISFSGGALPPAGTCVLTLSVTMTVNGNLTNAIAAGAVSTTSGARNPDPAEASLTNLPGASLSKFFEPGQITAGGQSLLTITIRNTGSVALGAMGLIDNLPEGVHVAGTGAPAPRNGCGGNLKAQGGTQVIELTGGALASGASCTLVVAVTGTTSGNYVNIIPAGALTNDDDATNEQPATDTLVITGSKPGNGGGKVTPPAGASLIPNTGFQPGIVTDLSSLPVTSYHSLQDVVLEIPALKLRMPVVGVPSQNGSWDVNWLANQAGWLEGTAFPGLSGNSILTGHVTSVYGSDGPFARLHELAPGDLLFVHEFGQLYIYKTMSIAQVSPQDESVFKHEAKPWLTLITCSEFDAGSGKYASRLVVRAVLVQTRADFAAR